MATTSPLEQHVDQPVIMNSRPLLVSELVSSYKGMNTSTLSDPVFENKDKLHASSSNKVIVDFADQSMPAS